MMDRAEYEEFGPAEDQDTRAKPSAMERRGRSAADVPSDVGERFPYQNAVAEYRRMLVYRTTEDLLAIAEARAPDLSHLDRDELIAELAARLSDPLSVRAALQQIENLGRAILHYLHLALTPGRGLSAASIIRDLSEQYASGHLRWFGEWTSGPHQLPGVDEASLRFPPRQPQVELPPLVSEGIPYGRAYGRLINNHIAMLSRKGLLLPFRQNHTMYFSVPLAVRSCLPTLPNLISPYPEKEVDSLETRETSFSALKHKLYDLWNAISTQDILVNDRGSGEAFTASDPYLRSSGLLSDTPAAAMAAFRLSDAARAILHEQTGYTVEELEFYYALLEDLGAVSSKPGHAVQVDQNAMQRFLAHPLADQIQVIYRKWKMQASWSEMDVVLRTVGEPPYADSSQEPQVRLRRSLTHLRAEDLYKEWRAGRMSVLRFLSHVSEGTWVSVTDLLRVVFSVDANLLHTHSTSSSWWLESPKTRKQFGTTFDDWQQSYGLFVSALLEGPLVWLGLATLGYSQDRLMALKLTPAGSFALGHHSTLGPDSADGTSDPAQVRDPALGRAQGRRSRLSCSFGEGLRVILVPSEVPPQLHDLLRSLGPLEEATPDRFVYRITAEGVHQWKESAVPSAEYGQVKSAALGEAGDHSEERGETPAQALIAQLGRWCHTDVPTSWQDRLHAWIQNYGKLHLYEGITLIELADDYALQELLVSTSLRDHLLYQFSPRMVAIRAEAADTLVEEMEKRGYTPRVQ
jgi:hypothetical protein